MRTFLRFLLIATALIGVLVFVVLPLVAGPILGSLAQGSGVAGEDLTVDVDASGPQLLSGNADGLRLRGGGLQLGATKVGSYDLTLGGVSLFERSFDTVEGTLNDVRLGSGGRAVALRSLELDGAAAAARARGQVSEREGERLIREAVQRAGVRVDDVVLEDGRVLLRTGSRTSTARLGVDDGAVIARVEGGRTVELLGGDASDRWRIDEISVTSDGLSLEGTLDVRSFATGLPGLGP